MGTTTEPKDAPQDTSEDVIRVKAGSPANGLAQSISHMVYERKKVVLRAIGAGAVNQAMKALAIARGLVAPRGYDLTVKPAFTEVNVSGEDYSAMMFIVVIDGGA